MQHVNTSPKETMQHVTRDMFRGIDHKQDGSKIKMKNATNNLLDRIRDNEKFLKQLRNGDKPLNVQSIAEINVARANALLCVMMIYEAASFFKLTDLYQIISQAAEDAYSLFFNIQHLSNILLGFFDKDYKLQPLKLWSKTIDDAFITLGLNPDEFLGYSDLIEPTKTPPTTTHPL